MSYRTIYVVSKSYISIKNNNLYLRQEDKEVSIPLEDTLSIVLDDKETTLTQKFIIKASQNNVMIYFTDDKHLPIASALPINNFCKPLIRLNSQINQSDKFKNRLWQKIIKKKILNQARVLQLNHKDYIMLEKVSDNVKLGDKSNAEGFAAQFYFNSLFSSDFSRNKDCLENFCLNYGYALVRGIVARSLVAYGFNCCLGIKHKNQYNAFNLADDFIEPIRPLVDLFVCTNLERFKEIKDITLLKKELVHILNLGIEWKNEKHRVNTAIDRMVVSYIGAIEAKRPELLELPVLSELRVHNYI